MFPPVDYPLKASQDDAAEVAEITYAALLDRYASEQPITNDMIQQACQKMDQAQQFPFAPIEAIDTMDPVANRSSSPRMVASTALLGRLKSIIR